MRFDPASLRSDNSLAQKSPLACRVHAGAAKTNQKRSADQPTCPKCQIYPNCCTWNWLTKGRATPIRECSSQCLLLTRFPSRPPIGFFVGLRWFCGHDQLGQCDRTGIQRHLSCRGKCVCSGFSARLSVNADKFTSINIKATVSGSLRYVRIGFTRAQQARPSNCLAGVLSGRGSSSTKPHLDTKASSTASRQLLVATKSRFLWELARPSSWKLPPLNAAAVRSPWAMVEASACLVIQWPVKGRSIFSSRETTNSLSLKRARSLAPLRQIPKPQVAA